MDEMVIDSETDSTTVEVVNPPEAGKTDAAETLQEGAAEGTDAVESGATAGSADSGGQVEPSSAVRVAGKGQTVPKERFDQVNNELTEMKSRLDLVEQNNAVMAANSAAPVEEFDVYKEAGVSEQGDDMISVDQHKKTLGYFSRTQQAQIDDLRFHVSNPDFTEVVGTIEQISQGKFAAPLAAALQENPGLLDQIKSSANPKQLALTIARTARDKEKAPDTDEGVIDEAVRNAARPKSVKTVRGGSGMSEEHRYSTMTDDAFIKVARGRGANV